MSDCIEIHPVTASADGKRNAYCHSCVLGSGDRMRSQRMSYAACLGRLEAIGRGDYPNDWDACRVAQQSGKCAAKGMREEEILQGKSIYFVARELMAAAGEAVRKWLMPGDPKASVPGVPTRRKSSSMFDAISDAGTYADAINSASATATAPVPTPAAVPKAAAPLPQALPGESPLAMARRLAAARKTEITTA